MVGAGLAAAYKLDAGWAAFFNNAMVRVSDSLHGPAGGHARHGCASLVAARGACTAFALGLHLEHMHARAGRSWLEVYTCIPACQAMVACGCRRLCAFHAPLSQMHAAGQRAGSCCLPPASLQDSNAFAGYEPELKPEGGYVGTRKVRATALALHPA